MKEIKIIDSSVEQKIKSEAHFLVRQVYEIAEHFGYETRNKYQILDSENNQVLFVAEQQKGVWGFLMRQNFGHWRPYTLNFYNGKKERVFEAIHKFSFFFQTLSVHDSSGTLVGTFKQRFSLLRRRFDVCDARGNVIIAMRTKIRFFFLWDYPFFKREKNVASVKKKFSGIFTEFYTDKDNFLVSFESKDLCLEEKILILSSSVFIDLMYFETKQ